MVMLERPIPPNMRVVDFNKVNPQCPSGILDGQSSLYRYAYSDCKHPILAIVDYIYDYNGKFIKPGHYELALSDDKTFLLLIESSELIAVVPVFKIAENQAEVEKYREQQDIASGKKKKKKESKTKERINAALRRKYAEKAITPEPEEYVYQNATIEYNKDGGYYLIMYENGMYRAWGAIKTRTGFEKELPNDIRGLDNLDMHK